VLEAGIPFLLGHLLEVDVVLAVGQLVVVVPEPRASSSAGARTLPLVDWSSRAIVHGV